MLKVALDTGPLYGHLTGVGRSVSEILTEFHRRRDEITVIPYVLSFRAPLEEGTRRLALPAALAIRSWSHSSFPRVDRALHDAQVIHGTNYVVPPARRPRIVTVHDCWALRHPNLCSSAVNRSMEVLRRAVATGAHVHTPSRATAAEVGDIFPTASITVVPWAAPRPIETATRPPGIPLTASTPFVLAVGTIEHRKNIGRLIAAFAAMADQLPDLVLVIAGARGNAAPEVDRIIATLPPSRRSRLMVLDSPGPAEVNWLYQHCSVLAYPSLDEGFGFPLLEAMSAGAPVVTANRGSLPEIAADAAIVVNPLDVEELAAALTAAVGDQQRRDSLIAAGRRRVADFSWSVTADGLMAMYRAVAAAANTDVPG